MLGWGHGKSVAQVVVSIARPGGVPFEQCTESECQVIVIEQSEGHVDQIGVDGLQCVNQLMHQHLVDSLAQVNSVSLSPGLCDDVELAVQWSVETGDRVGLKLDERLPEVRVGR